MANSRPTWSTAFIPNEEFVDDTYNADELSRMDGRELQSLAAKHPTDEVNGKSKAVDIREALEGAKRV